MAKRFIALGLVMGLLLAVFNIGQVDHVNEATKLFMIVSVKGTLLNTISFLIFT